MIKFQIASLLLFIGMTSMAQIDIDTNYVFKLGQSSDFEIVAKNNIYNDLEVNDTLRWIRVLKEANGGWESATCDNQTCWFPNIDSSEFVIAPKETANLDIYFYPQGNDGNGTVKLLVYQTSKGREKGDTITYESSSMAVGIDDEIGGSPIAVYPSVFSESISITYSGDAQVVLLQNGTVITSMRHTSGSSQLNTSELTGGAYQLRVSNGNGSIVTKLVKI